MRKFALLMASAALIAFQAPGANATPFDWSYTDGGSNVGNGTLNADLVSGDEYSVTSISGTADGQSILGPFVFDGSDQLVFSPAARVVDRLGVGFQLADGTLLNFYEDDGGYDVGNPFHCGAVYCLIGDSFAALALTDLTITPASETPLPATLPLFASGLGALGLLGWRRKRKVAQAA
jgi:hypothetical protein